MEKYQEVERSIITKFRKEIWSRFVKGVANYEQIAEGDKVMVCISGGKDSFLLAKCIQELIKHGKFKFEAKYVCMDPGYNKKNRELIEANAKLLGIPIEIFESDVFQVAEKLNGESPCYMCARMRRGFLYSKAQELGCNKIALGHHFDDVIETTLLSLFYGSEIKTMVPKIHSENFKGIELIRPLFLVKEHDILQWVKYNELTFLNCACKFTEKVANHEDASKRKQMKKLINEFRKENKNIDNNIFNAMGNINMSCILGYRDINGDEHEFVDYYDDLKR